MRGKVANLIAIELGLLILVGVWLAFGYSRTSHPGKSDVRPPESARSSFATVSSTRRVENLSATAVDDRAEPAGETIAEPITQQTVSDPVLLPDQATVVETNLRDEDLAAVAPTNENGLDDGIAAGPETYYSAVEPEPVYDSASYVPAAPNEYFVYPQSTTVVVIPNAVAPACRTILPPGRAPDPQHAYLPRRTSPRWSPPRPSSQLAPRRNDRAVPLPGTRPTRIPVAARPRPKTAPLHQP